MWGLSLKGQSFTYSYIDPCTKENKIIFADQGSPIVITYYTQVKTFSYTELYDGTFDLWMNSIYNQYKDKSPCQGATATTTQTTTSNIALTTITGVMNLNNLTSLTNLGASVNVGGTTNLGTNQNQNGNNNQESDPNNPYNVDNPSNPNVDGTGAQQGTNTGNTASNQGNGTNQPGNNNGNVSNGSSNSGNTTQGSQGTVPPGNQGGNTSENQSGSGSNQGQVNTNNSSSNNQGNVNNQNSGGSGNGNNGGSNGNGGSSQQGETNQETPPTPEEQAQAEEQQQNSTSQQTTKSTNKAKTQVAKPAILMTGDIVGMQTASDGTQDARGTASFTRVKGDGTASFGIAADYTVGAKISNISIVKSWIGQNEKGHKHINVVSDATTILPKSITNTAMFIRVNSLEKFTAVYGAAGTYGKLFEEEMISTLLIAGFMYKGSLSPSLDATIIAAGVWSPYTKFYTPSFMESPPIVIPFLNLNYRMTKTFGIGMTGGGTYIAGQNILNYQILMGAKLIL